jgi:Zn-dependent peptidase ImmA (M78 family)
MANDYLVKERSNNECSDLAKRARTWFGQSDAQYLDICECLTKGEVWTVYGVRRLVLKIRPDEEMGKDYAVTSYADGVITITVKQSCWDGAKQKQVRPRQTLAHELGHAVQGHAEMRIDKPMARREGAAGKYVSESQRPSQYKSAEGLPASKSAEHQAKVFAPAFLINDKIAGTLSGAQEIALAFGISLQSAEIYFDQLTKRKNRPASARRIRQKANETIAILSKRHTVPDNRNCLDAPCPSCGLYSLVQLDNRYCCTNPHCRFLGHLQDGDKATSI